MKTDKSRLRFVLCIRSNGAEDLEPRKVYQVLPDRTASSEGMLRVIDDSGEDYLYPADYFTPVRLPQGVARGFSAQTARYAQTAARSARRS